MAMGVSFQKFQISPSELGNVIFAIIFSFYYTTKLNNFLNYFLQKSFSKKGHIKGFTGMF